MKDPAVGAEIMDLSTFPLFDFFFFSGAAELAFDEPDVVVYISTAN